MSGWLAFGAVAATLILGWAILYCRECCREETGTWGAGNDDVSQDATTIAATIITGMTH